MSEAKFTKGPWRVDRTVALGAYGVWTEYTVADGATDHHVQIASVYTGNRSDVSREQRDANAALIAASPELYATLEKCLTVLEWFDNKPLFLEMAQDGRSITAAEVRAALSRARGDA